MNKWFAVIAALVIICYLPACTASKKVSKKNDKETNTVTVTKKADTTAIANKEKGITPEKKLLIDSLVPIWNKDINYTTFAGKARMHYEAGDDKKDFTANIRIQKDKIIWVSATALGGIVQVARIYITPDSFKMINYLDKSVTMMTLKQAEALLPTPMDYSILQNIIVGNVLDKTSNITDAIGLAGAWSLQAETPNYIQQVTYNKNDSTIRSEQFRDKKPGGPQAAIQYANYVLVDNRFFSFSRAINMSNAGQQYFLDMNYLSMDFDRVIDFPFTIPKNYLLK